MAGSNDPEYDRVVEKNNEIVCENWRLTARVAELEAEHDALAVANSRLRADLERIDPTGLLRSTTARQSVVTTENGGW